MVAANEASTWAAALEGDTRAFGEIYDRHYDRVFRHLIGITDQRADTDEVCASAFFELWRHRERVRMVNESVLPWLLLTAGNLARNHGRKARRYQDVLRRLPRDHEWVDPAAIVHDAADAEGRADAVADALRRLKPIDAQIVALTAHGDLTIVDAAAVLGISAGAARVRLLRVRQRLRLELAAILELPDLSGEVE